MQSTGRGAQPASQRLPASSDPSLRAPAACPLSAVHRPLSSVPRPVPPRQPPRPWRSVAGCSSSRMTTAALCPWPQAGLARWPACLSPLTRHAKSAGPPTALGPFCLSCPRLLLLSPSTLYHFASTHVCLAHGRRSRLERLPSALGQARTYMGHTCAHAHTCVPTYRPVRTTMVLAPRDAVRIRTHGSLCTKPAARQHHAQRPKLRLASTPEAPSLAGEWCH